MKQCCRRNIQLKMAKAFIWNDSFAKQFLKCSCTDFPLFSNHTFTTIKWIMSSYLCCQHYGRSLCLDVVLMHVWIVLQVTQNIIIVSLYFLCLSQNMKANHTTDAHRSVWNHSGGNPHLFCCKAWKNYFWLEYKLYTSTECFSILECHQKVMFSMIQ